MNITPRPARLPEGLIYAHFGTDNLIVKWGWYEITENMNNGSCVCRKTVDFVWILMTCSDFPVFEAQLLPVYTILHRFCLYGMFESLGDMEIYTCYWRSMNFLC